jgi:hypothetical protein
MATSLQPNDLSSVDGVANTGTINVGDTVYTFTKANGSGSRVLRGTYVGALCVEEQGYHGTHWWTYYLVDRDDGTRSKLSYPRMAPVGTTLDALNEQTLT